MLTKKFINTSLPLPDEDTTVKQALKLAKEFYLEQFPACVKEHYGFFFNADMERLPSDTPLGTVEHLMHKVALHADDHIWESIRHFNQHNAEVLPCISENRKYVGVIFIKDIFKRIFEIFPIGNGGAILELELSYNNYSLNELAGIVEGSNAKITLLSTFPIEGTTKVEVVFSIDKNDATEVIQALERHGYQVNAWFMDKGKIDKVLEERYEAFINYINV